MLITDGFNFQRRDDEEDEPHIVAEVMCVRCYKRWISVFPESTWLSQLECPQCHRQGYVIATGQAISDEDMEDDDV